MVTMRTPQGIATGALSVTLSIGLGGDNLDRPLDNALDLSQRLVNQVLDLCKGLGGLHPVIPNPFKPLGEDMLHHAANKGVDIHSLPLNSISLMGAIMVGHLLPIIAIDPPHRDRRTDDIFGQIHGQTLIAGRDIALLHIRHKPVGIPLITRIDQRIDRARHISRAYHCHFLCNMG